MAWGITHITFPPTFFPSQKDATSNTLLTQNFTGRVFSEDYRETILRCCEFLAQDPVWKKNNEQTAHFLLKSLTYSLLTSDSCHFLQKVQKLFDTSLAQLIDVLPQDVHFQVSKTTFSASALTLISRSSYFRSLFSLQFSEGRRLLTSYINDSSYTIELKEVEPKIVEAALTILQCGTPPPLTSFTLEEISLLLRYIDSIEGQNIAHSLLTSALLSITNNSNAYKLHELAKEFGLKEVTSHCIHTLVCTLSSKEIFNGVCMQALPYLNHSPEQEIREACLEWYLEHLGEWFELLEHQWNPALQTFSKDSSHRKKFIPDKLQKYLTSELISQAIENIHLFSKLGFFVKEVKKSYFHKLTHNEMEWVLDKINPEVKELNLSGSGLIYLRALERFSQLEKLSLSHCSQLTTLSALRDLKKLKQLDCSYCENLLFLKGIEYSRELEFLNIEGCSSVDISLFQFKGKHPLTILQGNSKSF